MMTPEPTASRSGRRDLGLVNAFGEARMVLPLLVGLGVLVVSLITYGVATAFLVQVVARFFRSHARGLTIPKDVAVMTLVGLVTVTAHLAQIAIWACVLVVVGENSTFEEAFYSSAQNYTALGFGDTIHSQRWRLLGPMEAINGLLLFGISTATMFAVMSRLITGRLRFQVSPACPAIAQRE
jgi:hypothetical protein